MFPSPLLWTTPRLPSWPTTRLRSSLSPDPTPNRGVAAVAVSLASVLANLTFSAQNCNSLNVSTTCPKQLKKIEAITSSKSSVIFLSDLCLNDSETVNDLKNIFLGCTSFQYDFIFNSSKNKRGTGILISCKLDFQILNKFSDDAENILITLLSL